MVATAAFTSLGTTSPLYICKYCECYSLSMTLMAKNWNKVRLLQDLLEYTFDRPVCCAYAWKPSLLWGGKGRIFR